ncbi:leucine-rich repeat flightless-interacting protein 1 isoform X18 [Perca fluviatilis]|uniref:leucine-rich repeat flightless-interacting protein 1 isoform X18 n=1 Tax=Perca fluviatilis TaxID=8168 RepID=UPI0019661427|nr:leucine-rich repeat flightless-interacting protein 1 isoform X18 [Perca fluviatilis]
MGTQGTGRKRSTKKERSTAEDDALNLIAREAEARLAAKRAARAEAREIRMKELERQQKEIFQVQKKYYGLNTKIDDRADSKWGDIEQWMEDSERYSRSSRIQTLSDDDERMSVGSRGSVRSDLDAVGAYGGGDSSSHKKSKKKKKHKHKDRNGCDDDYSVISSRSSRLSDESRVSRASRLDLTSSRLSDDTRVSRASRLDLQPASYASSDLYGFNGLSTSRKPGSTFNGYQSALYEDCSGSQRVSSSHPLEYTSYRSSGSRVSSRAGSARASPVDNCSSVASFLRSAANSSGLHRDLDDVTIPDFSDVEDRDYLEKGSRAASALTAATLPSLGGTSSRRGSGETAITVDAETSIREIKDVLVEVEEKYRKAMVSNAQLDNEKNNLMYQVDTLKDSLMELEELLSESRRGYEEKVKEYEREKHAHSVLQFQFNEMKETLKQSEELLNKHGIVLGPDLNINGEVGEAEVDGSPSADAASQPAQDSQASPAEGNSMLGNTEETQLRSSREEEVDPERHQEMFEEAKENCLSTDNLCNVAGVSTLETSSEEQPTEEQTCLEEDKKNATEEDTVEERGLSKNSNVDINDRSITEAKDIIICSPGLQGIVTSSEKNVPEKERPAGGDLGETETKSSSVDTKSDDIRESSNNLFEEGENKQEDVEESHLRNTEPCPQQIIVMTESLPDQCVRAVENTEPQPKPDNAEDAENDEAGEISSKTQPQCAAASGKKKKRKRKSKKKGGTHEDTNQQKDVTDKESDKTEIDIESATREKGPTAEPKVDGSVTETLRGSGVDQVKNEQHMQETEEVDGVKAVKPTETFSPNETLKESRMDDVTDGHGKEQTLGTENVGEAEAVATTETFSPNETLKESRMDDVTDEQNKEPGLEAETVEAVAPIETFSHVETLKETTADLRKDEQDKKQTLELEKVDEVGSITTPVPEMDLSTDLIDNSKGAESSDDLDKECAFSKDNSKSETNISTNDDVILTELENINSAEDKVGPIDEMKSECSTNNPENTFETSGNVSSNGDFAAEDSESTSIAESKENMSVSLSSTDGFTDALISLSGSDLSAAVNSGSDGTPIKVSEGGPKETTETAKDDDESGTENEQESFSPSVISSALKADRTEKEELNEGLREAEGLIKPDSSHDEKSDSCDSASSTKKTEAFDTVKSPLQTVAQAELLDDVESQTLQCEGQVDDSNVEVASESEEINTIDMLNTLASRKEATEIGSSPEQNHSTEAVAEDPEHENSQNDEQSETQRLPEPSKDKSEDNDSSQPTLQGSDEDNGEDDEGLSFDFDDMDVEAAVATSLSKNPEQEEVEEGVEVMSDESSNGISVQSKTESNEKSQEEPVERNDETCTVDGGNKVHEPDTMPRDNQNSLAHEDNTSEKGEHVENVCEKQKPMPGEEADVADEPRHIIEEGKVLDVGELGVVAEDINQAMSLPIEEGLDAIKHELQGENLELPKHVEQVASNKEPQQTGKDVKKISKKGKGKGKEECKMS